MDVPEPSVCDCSTTAGLSVRSPPPLAPVPCQRVPPVDGAGHHVIENLVVILLKRRNDFQDQEHLVGAGSTERREHAVSVDPSAGIERRREGPVMITLGVGLLQLHDWRS